MQAVALEANITGIARVAVPVTIAGLTMFGAVFLAAFRRHRTRRAQHQELRSLAIDPRAASISRGLPAFPSPPSGSPAYYGFPVLEDVVVDGFKLGVISDWVAQPEMQRGYAFVVAPDESRCGLVWDVSAEPLFEEAWRVDLDQWGVWNVGFPHPMDSRENARRNLAFVLPSLNQAWLDWRQMTAKWRL